MPKLDEYIAPQREIRPSDAGFNAFETAGRRVGGMYREAATDIAKAAQENANVLTDKNQWPFNLFALNQAMTKRAGAGGIGGFRMAGSSPSLSDEQFAPRVMPNLALANAAANASDGTPAGIDSLSPEGSHANTLANQAAALTDQLKGLIGSGDPTGAATGPVDWWSINGGYDATGPSQYQNPTGPMGDFSPMGGAPADTGGGGGGGGGGTDTGGGAVPDFSGAIP